MSLSHRYLIMAGGTGGHIFPAMAVAHKLREGGAEVAWLGTESGMESQLVPEHALTLYKIQIKGFRGKSVLAKLKTPFLLLSAVIQAWKIIRDYKPCVVVGFGGYVAAPGGIAARLAGIPLVIHEQNAVAGSTNKLLAKISNRNLQAFPNSLPNAEQVGNPVRADIINLSVLEEKDSKENKLPAERKNLLIMGGSLGALAINTILPTVIAAMDENVRPNIWHQAGKDKHQTLIAEYDRQGIQHRTEEFISDVAAAYQWADLIICRAGALTVSEIAVAALPAIFIPYPYAIDNHQYHNARWLVDENAALLIEQKDLTVDLLRQTLVNLLHDEDKLKSMSRALTTLAMPKATEQVAFMCEAICVNSTHVAAKSIGENNNAA